MYTFHTAHQLFSENNKAYVRVPMSNSCIVKPVVFEVIKMNAHYIELLIKAHLTTSMCLRENLCKISFTFIALRES